MLACKNAKIQTYGPALNNEVLIDLAEQETSEQALDQRQDSDHQRARDQRSGGETGPE